MRNQNHEEYFQGLAVDCVIFGFHEDTIKVLLLKFKDWDRWTLPGGFIKKDEDLDNAAIRVLKNRTGLDKIFLHQFHAFGSLSRRDDELVQGLVERNLTPMVSLGLERQRFITFGYYSLVDFTKANPVPDEISDLCEWCALDELPNLILDHEKIVQRALKTIRTQLRYLPIGMSLLPEKFTMSELQALYETILNMKLDRRNFQRKMLGYDILIRLEERRTGGSHKPPYLYKFDKAKYDQALIDGLNSIW